MAAATDGVGWTPGVAASAAPVADATLAAGCTIGAAVYAAAVADATWAVAVVLPPPLSCSAASDGCQSQDIYAIFLIDQSIERSVPLILSSVMSQPLMSTSDGLTHTGSDCALANRTANTRRWVLLLSTFS